MVGAALEIWAGMIDCAIGGGMENMDRVPYLLPQGRWGARMGDATLYDSMLMDGLNDAFSGPDGHPADTFYKEIEAALHNRYNITHSTIQIDHKPPGHGCAAVV
jgi:acetyl-CoA acetyltransferase